MIGELNKRIELLRQERTVNKRGGTTFSYDTVGEFWAAIIPLSQGEQNKYREAEIVTNVRFIMRRDPDENRRPKAGSHIRWGLKGYKVVAVLDSMDSNYLELLGVTL